MTKSTKLPISEEKVHEALTAEAQQAVRRLEADPRQRVEGHAVYIPQGAE